MEHTSSCAPLGAPHEATPPISSRYEEDEIKSRGFIGAFAAIVLSGVLVADGPATATTTHNLAGRQGCVDHQHAAHDVQSCCKRGSPIISEIPDLPANLLDLHSGWHNPLPHERRVGTRKVLPGKPGSGLEFLTFHREYIRQFQAWYVGRPAATQLAVAAWTAIPDELKVPETGWNAAAAKQERRIVANDPPFASSDELGAYIIESGLHSWLHGAVACVYNDPLIASFVSAPRSVYFWRFHGLIDQWWEQYELRRE